MHFLVLFLAILSIACTPNPTDKEKQAAWSEYLDEDFEIVDTIIRYHLTDTSLTLTFDKPPIFNQWLLEVGISDTSNQTLIHLPEREGDHLDTVYFKKGQLTFRNFHLNDVSPENCTIWIYLCPLIPGKQLWSDPLLSFPYMMVDRDSNHTLKPWTKFHESNYITFNKTHYDTLSSELQKHCTLKKAEYISRQSVFFPNTHASNVSDSHRSCRE